jgi:hypothetical protein
MNTHSYKYYHLQYHSASGPTLNTHMRLRRSMRNGSLLLLNDNSLLRFVTAGAPQFPRIRCRGSVRSDCSVCRGDGRKVTRHIMLLYKDSHSVSILLMC